MKKFYVSSFFIVLAFTVAGQQSTYADSLQRFRNQYILTHGVIKEADRPKLQFYPINEKYAVEARVERIYEAPWFQMSTSGKIKKTFRVYAVLHFSLDETACKLTVYQSQQLLNNPAYADYLFIPFMDLTNGEHTYENGRYIDITTNEMEKGPFYLDFNKTYNPYCAYISNVYNCPVPPAENNLSVAISAGEKKFSK
ncbi:MAG: DUF1684 domain-containing protein [Chitinophagales bacterium]|nr:DUF1684 domain-containing protein [Chitinophagales bacterium]